MGKKARVMVVEDDATLRETLAELLEIWGYQAATASDGIDALEKMCSFRPRVVISDLQMPRMGGMKLLQAVRDRFPDVSCIIVTGERSAENATQASTVGAFDLLEKPIDPLRLRLDLQTFLGHPEAKVRLQCGGTSGQDRRARQSGLLLDEAPLR